MKGTEDRRSEIGVRPVAASFSLRSPLDRALRDVRRERGRHLLLLAQGKIKHDCAAPATPLQDAFMTLTEEFGESAIEANAIIENGRLRYGALREELIQLAAVAVAICEALEARR